MSDYEPEYDGLPDTPNSYGGSDMHLIPEPYDYSYSGADAYKEIGLQGIDERFNDVGYDWEVIGVWFHPETGTYRVDTDGGCSCNGPWESHHQLADFGDPLTAAEARKKVLEFDTYHFSPVAKQRIVGAIQYHARKHADKVAPGLTQ